MKDKYFLGGLLSLVPTAVNLVSGLIGNNKAKKEQQAFEQEARYKNMMDYSKSVLEYYPTQGMGSTALYQKMGGRVPGYGKIKGGYYKRLGGDVGKFIGDKHGQDSNGDGHEGITLFQGDQPYAEVESGEVMKGEKVYSATIPYGSSSFASRAEEVATSPDYQKQLKTRTMAINKLNNPSSSIASKNTAKRIMETTKDPLDDLFAEQEAYKAENGIQNNVRQAKFGDFIPMLADNLTNAVLTATTPKTPQPVLTQAPRLNTQYSTSAQESNISRAKERTTDVILDNSSNSAMARKSAAIAGQGFLTQENELADRKFNIENQLENQQAMISYQNRLGNNQLVNQYRQQEFQRKNDIQAKVSENVSNLSEDIQMYRREQNMALLDNKRIALEMMKYQNTGVLDRANFGTVMDMIEAGLSPQEALELAKRRKGDKNLLKGMPGLNSNKTESMYQSNSYLRHIPGLQ